MFFYFISYDIPSNQRRKKISDLLEGYGQRVQYSVFECVLKQEKYQELRDRLQQKIAREEDSIRFYPISEHTLGKIETWGGIPPTEKSSSTII